MELGSNNADVRMRGVAPAWRVLEWAFASLTFCALGYLVLFCALRPTARLLDARLTMGLVDHGPHVESVLAKRYEQGKRKPPEPKPEPPAEPEFVPESQVTVPESGERYGHMSCERVGLDCDVYWDDTDYILDLGAGQTTVSFLPGYGRPVILAGHNLTYFACLYDMQVGDVVSYQTPWCHYEYTVTDIKVYDEEELNTLLLKMIDEEKPKQEQLVFYTCYPHEVISWRKTQRLVAFANRTAGLDVKAEVSP